MKSTNEEIWRFEFDGVILTGTIEQDEYGIWIAHCNELDLDCYSENKDNLFVYCLSMLKGYLAATKKLGTYEFVMANLRVGNG